MAGRYINSDYALAHAIEGTESVPIHHVSYDIMCQYGVNLVERFRKQFPEKVHLVERLQREIPKMHLISHKDDCQYSYSFNYQVGVGRTDGEAPERFWAEANICAGFTKQQNGGHRHDTLDDITGDSNWRKNVQMGNFVL